MTLRLKNIMFLVLASAFLFVIINACRKDNSGTIVSNGNADQLPLSSSDQSPISNAASAGISDAEKIQQWKIAIGQTKAPETGCLQPGGTGPYDPSECLKKMLEELLGLQKKAKDRPDILSLLTKASVEVDQIIKRWEALPLKEKQKRQAITASLNKTISANSYDFRKGLDSFIVESADKQASAFAKAALNDNGRSCIPMCICVGPDACPCCDWFIWIKVLAA